MPMLETVAGKVQTLGMYVLDCIVNHVVGMHIVCYTLLKLSPTPSLVGA
jgi:hypothetical protein